MSECGWPICPSVVKEGQTICFIEFLFPLTFFIFSSQASHVDRVRETKNSAKLPSVVLGGGARLGRSDGSGCSSSQLVAVKDGRSNNE